MAQSIQVEGSFCCRQTVKTEQLARIGLNHKGESVRLTGAAVKGDIDFDRARISGRFRCRRARCGKNLRLENTRFSFKRLEQKRDDQELIAEVDLYESEIEGTLHLNGLRAPFVCLERTHVGKIFWEKLGPIEPPTEGDEPISRIPSFDLTECQYQNINVNALDQETLPLRGPGSFEEEARTSFDLVKGTLVAGLDLFPDFKIVRTESWQFKTILIPTLLGILFGAFFWGQVLDHFGLLEWQSGLLWFLGVLGFTAVVFPVFWYNPACEHRCLEQCAQSRFLKLHVRGKSSPFEEGVYRTMESWLRERGREDNADFVYLLMRRLELQRLDKRFTFSTAFKRLFLHVLGYGIDIQRILFIYMIPVLTAFALFIPNESVEWHAELSGECAYTDPVEPWEFPHGPLGMTLRISIPMVTHHVWYRAVPSQEGVVLKTPIGSLERIDLSSVGLTVDLLSDLLVILNWVLVSFLLITVTGVIRERRV